MRNIAPKSFWKRFLERVVDTFWYNLGRVPEKEFYIDDHVQAGNCRVVEELFRGNPDLANYKDMFGNPLLTWAVYEGQVEMCRLLLKLGCPIDGTDAEGATALHEAVLVENAGLVVLLLSHGASPQIADENGDYPVDWAEPELLVEIEKMMADQALTGRSL